MRLLIVGTLKGQLTTATKIAMDNGASVTHAEGNEQKSDDQEIHANNRHGLLLSNVALQRGALVLEVFTRYLTRHTR